jgi:hypothetical protein
LTDVTLSCGPRLFAAHKLVLSVCSGYFSQLFARRTPPGASSNVAYGQTIVYLKDVEPKHMELILTYMYRGEINVKEGDLMALLETAKGLQVKGLSEAGETSASGGLGTLGETGTVAGKRKTVVVNSDDDIKRIKREERWTGASSAAAAGGALPDTLEYDMADYDDGPHQVCPLHSPLFASFVSKEC